MGRRAMGWTVAAVLVGCAWTPAAGAQTASAGCGWTLKSDPETLNVAFPDEQATYWVATFVPAPGTRVKITGRYTRARYFSFHAYSASLTPVGGLADAEIDPDDGSANPFRTGRRARAGRDRYSAYLQFADKPAQAAPNTFYNGASNPLASVIYRVYVPTDPKSVKGSVPLPTLTLETADGSRTLARLGRCPTLPPEGDGSVNTAINATRFPAAAPRPLPWLRAENPPFFDRAGALGAGTVPANPVTGDGSQPSFFANQHNAYVRGSFSRQFGDLFVIRAKAPTFPDTRRGVPVTADRQVRYWSICMNEFATQRYVSCVSDHQAVLDAPGDVTIVVADPAQRPANADAAHDINFLPWPGAYYDALVLYRHMLPAADFAFAVQRMTVGERLTDQMGPYTPVARYCDRQTIETKGVDACFAG